MYIQKKGDKMEKVTVDFIGTVLRMFPRDSQLDLLFQRMPFGMPPVILVPDGNGSKMMVLDNNENIQKAITFKLDYMINSSKSVGECFYHISKPNRLQIFEIISNMREFTEKDYNTILKNIWVTTEFPHQMPIPKLVKLFRKANPKLMMTDDDISIYSNLPETVTIYRGLMDKKSKVRGLSWTTDFERAEWFANRFNRGGKIMKADIKKQHIFMFTNDRSEKECVVNPKGLKNVCVMTGL